MQGLFSDNRKIGIGLLGFGSFMMLMGIVFFFDRGLLALGNLMFLSAFPFLIGFSR
jgi:hypothetical protein